MMALPRTPAFRAAQTRRESQAGPLSTKLYLILPGALVVWGVKQGPNDMTATTGRSFDVRNSLVFWLCPISEDLESRNILNMLAKT